MWILKLLIAVTILQIHKGEIEVTGVFHVPFIYKSDKRIKTVFIVKGTDDEFQNKINFSYNEGEFEELDKEEITYVSNIADSSLEFYRLLKKSNKHKSNKFLQYVYKTTDITEQLLEEIDKNEFVYTNSENYHKLTVSYNNPNKNIYLFRSDYKLKKNEKDVDFNFSILYESKNIYTGSFKTSFFNVQKEHKIAVVSGLDTADHNSHLTSISKSNPELIIFNGGLGNLQNFHYSSFYYLLNNQQNVFLNCLVYFNYGSNEINDIYKPLFQIANYSEPNMEFKVGKYDFILKNTADIDVNYYLKKIVNQFIILPNNQNKDQLKEEIDKKEFTPSGNFNYIIEGDDQKNVIKEYLLNSGEKIANFLVGNKPNNSLVEKQDENQYMVKESDKFYFTLITVYLGEKDAIVEIKEVSEYSKLPTTVPPQEDTDKSDDDKKAPVKKGSKIIMYVVIGALVFAVAGIVLYFVLNKKKSKKTINKKMLELTSNKKKVAN